MTSEEMRRNMQAAMSVREIKVYFVTLIDDTFTVIERYYNKPGVQFHIDDWHGCREIKELYATSEEAYDEAMKLNKEIPVKERWQWLFKHEGYKH